MWFLEVAPNYTFADHRRAEKVYHAPQGQQSGLLHTIFAQPGGLVPPI